MPNYLYNGVELPALPSYDKATYPNAVIRNTSNVYDLLVVKTLTPRGKDPIFGYYEYDVGEGERYIITDGEWVFDNSIATDNTYVVAIVDTLWTNTTLSSEDGTEYLAASDPVPVPTLTERDLYRKINGKPTKLTLYKKVGGELIPLDEHTKEVKT